LLKFSLNPAGRVFRDAAGCFYWSSCFCSSYCFIGRPFYWSSFLLVVLARRRELMNDARELDANETAGAISKNRWRRRLRWLLAPLLAYGLLLIGMMLMENSLIYFPSVYPEGEWDPPGLAFEDAWFESADGTKLHGWYVPHASQRAVVLIAHGNAGNLSHRYELLHDLAELGVSTMIFDYRGYGRSAGAPSEAGILADARAARAWLAKRAGVSEPEIVLMGESLGGGVMVDLAAHDGARGLVLENTFTSLPDVAAFHYPWLPVKTLMRTRMDSAAKIGTFHGPLLQVHGDADTIIPYPIGQRLHAAANEPKTLLTIPGGNHNDARTPAFFEALDRFLSEL
jgi:fermentation-respiration switch protein FrsA (DUF1100 family)